MTETTLALVAVALLTGLCIVLFYLLREAQAELRELQRQRVEDVKWFAGQAGPQEAEVEDIGTPDSRAQEAVKQLDEEVAFTFLKRKAQEEDRQVSESRLREDAKKLVREWGMGPKSPNV